MQHCPRVDEDTISFNFGCFALLRRTSLSGVDLAVDVTCYLFASVGLRLVVIF